MNLKNRFVRSATRDGFADDRGHMTGELLKVYEDLARGGAGTIITGHAYVTDLEQSKQPRQMGIYDDSFVDDYRRLTETVHGHDAAIILQINCVGAQTYAGGAERLIWGPSPVADLFTGITPREMTGEEILFLQRAFADAADRAKRAGFDGVQIHGAHGYILSKFLSPYYNRRSDRYGGALENRARMLFETYGAIRDRVGPAYPVLAKINCGDFMDQGATFADSLYVCEGLAAAGIDAIEVSGGNLASRPNEGPIRIIRREQESYFRAYAAEIAAHVDVPVMLVGGNRDATALADVLNQTKIEYVSLCRPLICESDLINRWHGGDLTPAKCISCNKCLGLESTTCIFNRRKAQDERTRS
jgi:2,4-dienoyl-CoA reductase-like NADH-dependent reductase (Old Yellow Enzyme family)